jgi:2'-5' RNA ligase
VARRIFVGLPVDADAAHELAAFARRRLGALPVRALEPAMLHATLVFCGVTDEDRVAEIAGIVEEETPYDLDWELAPNGLRQLGSVVAVTYDAPPLLAAVQRAVERRLVVEGLADDERRRWLPHVTIARGRRGARFRTPPGAPPAVVLRGDAIVVYESLLRPTGAEYVPLGASPRRG